MKRRGIAVLSVVVLAFGLAAGCSESDGPMEEAGETMDNAMEEVQEGMEDAGEEIEEAAEEVGDAVRDATN